MESTGKMLTVRDVAARLNVSPGCVYRLVSDGDLPHIRIGAGRGTIRVDEADLEAFVRVGKSQPKAMVSPPSIEKVFVHLDADRLRAAWSAGK
jgi:excisionase family DNA binding protein